MGRKTDNTYLTVEDWELMSSISSPLWPCRWRTLSSIRAWKPSLTELNLLKEFNENIIENINLGIWSSPA